MVDVDCSSSLEEGNVDHEEVGRNNISVGRGIEVVEGVEVGRVNETSSDCASIVVAGGVLGDPHQIGNHEDFVGSVDCSHWYLICISDGQVVIRSKYGICYMTGVE